MKSYSYCFTLQDMHLTKVSVLTIYGPVSHRRADKIRKSLPEGRAFEDAYFFEFSNHVDFNASWHQELRLSTYPCQICHAF